MGLFNSIINSLTDPVDESQSKPKKGFIDSLFVDESMPVEKKPGKIRSFIDSLYEDEPQVNFTDSDDVNNAFSNLSGKIKVYQKKINMLSIGVSSISNPENFSGSQEVINNYCALAEKFKELEPYMSVSERDIDSFTQAQLEIKMNEFENSYNKLIPTVQTLCWLSETTKANHEMKTLYDSGTLKEITYSKLEEFYDYIIQIVKNKSTFEGYKKELVAELLKAEYRWKILKLMRDIGSRNTEILESPFAKSGDLKKSEFERFFLEDFDSLRQQCENVFGLKRQYIEEAHICSSEYFDKLDKKQEAIFSRLNLFMIGDFSISEIFSPSGTGFETLKDFLSLKLDLNTLKSKFREYIENTPIRRRTSSDTKRKASDDDRGCKKRNE